MFELPPPRYRFTKVNYQQKNPSLPVWEASSNQSPLFQTSGEKGSAVTKYSGYMVDLPRKIGSLGDKGLTKIPPYIECLKLSWIDPKIQKKQLPCFLYWFQRGYIPEN